MDLGTAIWSARTLRGLTQEQLSEQLNITVSHLKHIESGHRKPSVDVLFSIVKILDMSLDSLIFDNQFSVPVIHTDGLTSEEIGVIAHLTDIFRNNKHQ